jgi:hypothetical protein
LHQREFAEPRPLRSGVLAIFYRYFSLSSRRKGIPLFKTISLVVFAGLATVVVRAEEFSIQVGSPVATQSYSAKSAAFAFRTRGCADPSSVEAGGTAEGFVSGKRQTIRLAKMSSPSAGTFAVFREWPSEGVWVANITARCSGATAGALVAVGPNGFLRESSKFFPRAATGKEVDALLKTLGEGANDTEGAAK